MSANPPSEPPAASPCPVSQWYGSLSVYTFPTLFLALTADEIAALLERQDEGKTVRDILAKLNRGINILPGSSFVHADVCAPTDSPRFQKRRGAVKNGRTAWSFLLESDKVHQAFADGHSTRLALHPYRRMDRVREFRLFVKGRRLCAISQICLERHFARLDKRQDEIWRKGKALASQIAPALPRDDIAIDVYLTSAGELMIIDMNPWGPPTDPLLLRQWDQDWDEEIGLKLIPPPIRLGGDVSVSP